MIDYRSYYSNQVEDLLDFMQAETGIADRQAVRIWLSCLLPVAERCEYPPAKVALETDYSTPFTFNHTRKDRVLNLGRFLSLRPRKAQVEVTDWLERIEEGDEPLVIVDSTWRRPVGGLRKHPYHQIKHVALKVRVDEPLVRPPDIDKLRALGQMIDSCLDLDHRPDSLLPSVYRLPDYLVEMAQIVYRLNKDYWGHWESVYKNLSMVISGHARLRGGEEPEEEDISAGLRTLRDSIRIWTRKVIEGLCEKDSMVGVRMLARIINQPEPEVATELAWLRAVGFVKKERKYYTGTQELFGAVRGALGSKSEMTAIY